MLSAVPYISPPMFGHVPNHALDAPPLEPGQETGFDWSARLSMEAMRDHTKTGDVPGVTDAQLRLYRDAAIEAAQLYTGFLLSGQRTITEPIQGPRSVRPGKIDYRFTLRYPVADGLVYLYGGTHTNDNRVFHVPPGTRTIQVPIVKDGLDMSNCCDPCNTWHLNGGMMAAYKAGFASPAEVPAGVVLGMLKYISWTLEHPGDTVATVTGDVSTRGISAQGTNSVALASGALEIWRSYDPEAI